MGGTEPPSTTVYDFVPIEKHAETTPSGIEQRSAAATAQFDPLQGAPQMAQMAPPQPLPTVPVAPLGKIAPGVSPQMSLVIPLGIRPETVQQVGGMVGRIMDSVRDFIGAMAWGPPVPEPIVTRFKRKTPHGDASDDNA
ncbi:unnamed protein product [Nippostrongylus brasiliensis]|uniref:ESX-1 secretion-associated protein EspI n=1 Tax=Nippostrongylus brasiliensis TaxID=27835 RepID=A0A0N4YF31_NIPBR|nr:unnamed protein product [Nippostrongylus brasiliensis]